MNSTNPTDAQLNAELINAYISANNLPTPIKNVTADKVGFLWNENATNPEPDELTGFFASLIIADNQYVATLKENNSPIQKIWNAATIGMPFHELPDDWIPVDFFDSIIFLNALLN